jgi:hypothetical protein
VQENQAKWWHWWTISVLILIGVIVLPFYNPDIRTSMELLAALSFIFGLGLFCFVAGAVIAPRRKNSES